MKPSKNIKLSKAKADKYFSLFIRERDKNKPCITCNKHAREYDCGHFLSRRFESVRFDEKNAHSQCLKCNRFEYGNQFEHGVKVDLLYGKGTAEKLLQKSKMFCKHSKFDYEFIAEEFKTKYDDLRLKQ